MKKNFARPVFVASVVALLSCLAGSPTALQAVAQEATAGSSTPPSPAPSGTRSGLVERVAQLLNLPKNVLSKVLRGDESSIAGAVVIGQIEAGRWVEKARTRRTDLRAPAYDARRKRITVFTDTQLGELELEGAFHELGAVSGLDPTTVRALLGSDKSARVVALTRAGEVRFIDVARRPPGLVPTPADLGGSLSNDDATKLIAAARTCGNKRLETQEVTQTRGTRRNVVYMRDEANAAATPLTQRLAGVGQYDPVFLGACDRIAYVEAQ